MNIKVERQRLRRNVQIIAGERSPFGDRGRLCAVGNFIEAEFAGYGLDVDRDGFSYAVEEFQNIIARLHRREGDPQ